MQVKIKRPIMLGGKTYRPGAHDVQVQDGERWFFDALLASGDVETTSKAVEKPQEPAKEPDATPAAPEAEKPRKRAKKAD
jgi:hypothetical protein